MKKFLCMTMLMLAALTASAMAQTKAASPPGQDIGYQQAATLSLDGMTVYAFGAVTIATPAAEVGNGLVAYRWPGCKPECTTTDAITPTTCRTVAGAYPLTTAHTDTL